MTHDLVERLRWWGAKRKPPRGMEAFPLACREAADRIESLERENATLRAEKDEIRKATIEEAEKVAEGYAPRSFDSGAIAAAIRNMGERA